MAEALTADPVAAQQQPAAHPAQDRVTQALAVVLGTGATAATLAGTVVALLATLGIGAKAARAALAVASASPLPRPATPGVGVAAAQVRASAATYRAAYLLAAARRIQAALAAGRPLADALTAEKRYFAAHLAAQANRRHAAAAVDVQAAAHGPVLGWYAVMDGHTSAECAAANGTNFSILSRPAIGWPGSVHPHCRCAAGPPHAGAGAVDDAVAPLLRRAA